MNLALREAVSRTIRELHDKGMPMGRSGCRLKGLPFRYLSFDKVDGEALITGQTLHGEFFKISPDTKRIEFGGIQCCQQ